MCLAGVDICIPQRISTEPLRAGASKAPEIPSPAGNHAARTSLPRQAALCLHLAHGIFKAVATLILSPEAEHLMCPFTLPNHRVPSTRPFKQLIKSPLTHHYCGFRQRSCSGACSPLGALRSSVIKTVKPLSSRATRRTLGKWQIHTSFCKLRFGAGWFKGYCLPSRHL